MTRHHLQYWRPATVDHSYQLRREGRWPEAHQATAGAVLKGVQPGEVVWNVTVKKGKLKLVGRLLAGGCGVSRRVAAKLLKRRPSDLWDSDCWVIACRARN